jgi:hypothetical protein
LYKRAGLLAALTVNVCNDDCDSMSHILLAATRRIGKGDSDSTANSAGPTRDNHNCSNFWLRGAGLHTGRTPWFEIESCGFDHSLSAMR